MIIILINHRIMIYFFSTSTVVVSVVTNMVANLVPLLLPYCCKPMFEFCKQNSSQMNVKMIFNLILFLAVEVLSLILTSFGFLVHLETYLIILYIGSTLAQMLILVVALYLLSMGVAFISFESKKVC